MSASEAGFASVPPQVQIGEHRQTFNVHVHAVGGGNVAVTLKSPDGRTTLRTMHAEDSETGILVAITTIGREAKPQLEAMHRADMKARGYTT